MANVDKNQLEKFRTAWAKIIARSWKDKQFKQRLMNNPAEVLKEHGITPPPGVSFKVCEETPTLGYLVLPAEPKAGEQLSEETMKAMAAGFSSALAVWRHQE